VQDIDLFEINEAFSNVPMAAMKELGIHRDRLNVWGGAVSLGHPIGCSGARVLCTLISALIQHNARLGCAAVCLGGGEAVAMVVSRQ
jgi:acetyl-CoA C-acetyltransferase